MAHLWLDKYLQICRPWYLGREGTSKVFSLKFIFNDMKKIRYLILKVVLMFKWCLEIKYVTSVLTKFNFASDNNYRNGPSVWNGGKILYLRHNPHWPHNTLGLSPPLGHHVRRVSQLDREPRRHSPAELRQPHLPERRIRTGPHTISQFGREGNLWEMESESCWTIESIFFCSRWSFEKR